MIPAASLVRRELHLAPVIIPHKDKWLLPTSRWLNAFSVVVIGCVEVSRLGHQMPIPPSDPFWHEGCLSHPSVSTLAASSATSRQASGIGGSGIQGLLFLDAMNCLALR